ncbi:MAG: hypothetical protein MJ200_02680 [Mycoplasmoidaceae bacterium]|nr:hypothetical protein [Mycoplasmoidaceae bacterium]
METPDFKADKTTEINVSKRFKLYRKLTGSDEIKVTIPSQETRPDGSNFIECSNYSVIEDGGLYYVDLTLKLNLLQDEIFTSHDY